MRLAEIEASLADYEEAFVEFNNAYQIPTEWFRQKDHFAIKCANAEDYEETLDQVKNYLQPEGMWEVEMDGRRLASAVLAGTILIGNTYFRWVEIMQPRPGKELEKGFVEHTEFVFMDGFEVQRVLGIRGVEGVEEQQNPGHKWVNVPIDAQGREIKFNDKPLEEVIEFEQDEGIGRVILPYQKFDKADVLELRPRRNK